MFFVFTGMALTGTFSNKVLAQPTASISIVGPSAVCEPSSIQIRFSATGTPPFSFSYNINGAPQTPISTNPPDTTINEARPGVWTYSLTSITDGLGTTVPQSGAVAFTVNPMPQAWVTGDAEVCQFDPIVLVVFHGSNGTFPYTMTYTQNGVLDTITLSVLDSILFPVSTSDVGTFIFSLLNVHDYNGCNGQIQNDSVAIIIKDCIQLQIGIENGASNKNTSISPNPFSNQLSIVTDKASAIKITNISGIEVYNAKVNAGKSLIDTNGFSSGVYFITITDEQTTVTKKLVKE